MTTVIYGIKNCDTVKKALRWLDDAGVEYRFHDFRVDGLDSDKVEGWIEAEGWETVINRRSTSWKALPQEQRDRLDAASAAAAACDAREDSSRAPRSSSFRFRDASNSARVGRADSRKVVGSDGGALMMMLLAPEASKPPSLATQKESGVTLSAPAANWCRRVPEY